METNYPLEIKCPLKEDVKIVRIDEYYDGPLAGVCECEGKQYYFWWWDCNELYQMYLMFEVLEQDLANEQGLLNLGWEDIIKYPIFGWFK